MIDQRWILALLVIGKMAAGAIKIELADMRSKYLAVTLTAQFSRDEILQFVAYDCPIRSPKNEALTYLFVYVKKAQLTPQYPMVPLFGFFQHL